MGLLTVAGFSWDGILKSSAKKRLHCSAPWHKLLVMLGLGRTGQVAATGMSLFKGEGGGGKGPGSEVFASALARRRAATDASAEGKLV